jgi:hypothetical protein
MDGQPYWMLPTALHGLMLAPDAACVRVTLEGEGFVDQPIAVTTIGVVSLGSHLFTHAGRMRKVELLPGWGDSHASHANDASDRLGRYEDTGDSYPVCDVCGDIGLSHSKDGDPCLACLQRQEENRLN